VKSVKCILFITCNLHQTFVGWRNQSHGKGLWCEWRGKVKDL